MSPYSSVFKYGCATLFALLPFMVQAQLNITIQQDRQPACFGFTNGQVSAAVTGGTAPYTFAWSAGNSTSSVLAGIGAGNYTVTVTDNANVSVVKTFAVGEPTVLRSAPAAVSGNVCAANNENYAANSTGGTSPYTYRWSNAANATVGTAATQFMANAGQYYIGVTDANGCTSTNSAIVTAPMVARFEKNDVTCGGECDGSAMAVVTGGTGPYTYLWNFMPMSPPNNNTHHTSVMFPVPGGTYTCTITDAVGCVRTVTGSIYEPEKVGLNFTLTSGNLCTGSASIQAVGTGGFAGPKTYTLTAQNNTLIGTNTTGTFANLGIGEYHLVVKDPQNCPKDTLFSIRDISTLNVTTTQTAATCAGINNGSATAQITGGNGPWRYVWSNGATSAQVVNLAPGAYTVSVYDGRNCFKTASVTIGTSLALALTTNGVNAACTNNNGSASVAVQNGTAPYTYTWSNGATTATANQLGSGNYVVTVRDANGCQMVSNPVVVSANNALVATGVGTPAICTASNGSIQITPTSGTAPYNYVLNGSTNATGQFSNVAAGNYTIAISDANGCNTTTSVTVTNDNRVVNITPTVINTSCRSSDGRINVTATGSTNFFQYTLAGTPAVTNTTGQFVGLATGNYTITAIDGNGCRGTTTAAVSNGSAGLTCGATTTAATCTSATGAFTVNPGGGRGPYTYTLNGTVYNSPIFTGVAAGDYTIIMTDANGCQLSSIITVPRNTIAINLNVNATGTGCAGATGTATAVANGGTAPYRYTLNGVTNATGTFSNLSAGNFTVSVTDANGCQNNVAVQVPTNNASITATAIASSTFCGSNSGSLTFTAAGGTTPYRYTLNGVTNTTGHFTNLGANNYTVSITDATGCQTTRSATVSNHNATLTATATMTQAICTNGTGSLTVTASGGNLPYTYAINGASNTDGVFTRLAAGTYVVTITDANNCQMTQNQVVTATNSVVTPTATTVSTTCVGNNGQITASATGGTNSYRFELPTANNTNGQFSSLAAGSYVVTVIDGNGCRATTNATVNSGANTIAGTATTTAAICTNNNGVMVVTGTGGTAPYRYAVNGTSNLSGRFENLAGNTYEVTITDAGNCRTTTSVTIPVNNVAVSANVTARSATCRGNDGGLTIVATGGNGSFWYAVNGNNSNTNGIFANLVPGTYTVIATDGNGCQASVTGLVQDGSRLLNPSVQATTPAVCTGTSGTASLVVTGGTGNYNYSLNGVTNATGQFTGLATGTYTATITDGTTCRTTVPVTIGNTTSNVVLTSDRVAATSCIGSDGSIVVSASGGTSPYTYRLNTSTNTNGRFTGLSSNTYNITVTDANGCNSSVSATVNAANGLLANINNVQIPTCRNANGRFRVVPSNGTAPYIYRLPTIANTSGIFDNLASGNYVVTVTDRNSCVTTLPVVALQSIGGIAAAVTATPVRCTGDSVTIRFTDASTVTGGGTQFDRNWLLGNGLTSTNPSIEATFSTRTANVRLISTSTQGCADTIQQSLPVGLLEIAIQDTATNCQNTSVNVVATNNSLGAPVNYTWTPSNLIASGGNTATPSLTVGTTRQTVYVSMTNGICTKTDSVVINPIIPTPIDLARIRNLANCSNGLKVDFSNGNANSGIYRWAFGDPANPTAGASTANASYTYRNAGTYTALLIPSAACLDTIRLPLTVQAGAAVQVRAIPDYQTGVNYCNANTTIQLKARSNVSTLRWSSDRNFTRILGTDSLLNVVPANGSQLLYVEAIDARGCKTLDSTKLTDRSVGIELPAQLGICTDGTGRLVAINLNSRDTLAITWTPPTGVTVIKGQGELIADVSGSGTGYIFGFFRNQWGCTKRDSVKTNMIEMTASLTARDTVIEKGEQTELVAKPNQGSYSYVWNPNPGTISTSQLTVKPDSTTTYNVIVVDSNGCRAMAKVKVRVISPECANPYIFIPNAFSPNGDGHNEMLYVRGDYLVQCYFAVYNRWGEIVFDTNDKANGWNGVHKGTPVCPDVYGYYLSGKCKNGEPIFMKGNITVLK